MAISLQKKKGNVDSLLFLCSSNTYIIVAMYSNMSANLMNELRLQCYNAGAKVKVVKNKLAKKAFLQTKFEKICSTLSKSTLFVVFSSDVAKVMGILYSKFVVFNFIRFKSFFLEEVFFDDSYSERILHLPTKGGVIKNFIDIFKFLFSKFVFFLKLFLNKFVFLLLLLKNRLVGKNN